MFELIPCNNTKCNDYNEEFKCHCERLTFLSAPKCKKFKPGFKIQIDVNPELDSFSNSIQGQRK